MWAMLPGAILWGASFPLALASVADGRQGPGAPGRRRLCRQHGRRDRRVARPRASCWSTGSGRQHAQQVLIVISAVSALLMLESAAAEAEAKKSRFQFAGTLLLAAAMGGAVLLARTVQPVPGVFVAYGRYAATRLGESEVIYMGEGVERLGRGHAPLERRAQLPQRRQGPGVERAAGHAPAADARPHDDAHSEEPDDRSW